MSAMAVVSPAPVAAAVEIKVRMQGMSPNKKISKSNSTSRILII